MYFLNFIINFDLFLLKSVDAALLPTISFPAFSTHEEVLYNETKANIIRRLKCSYGFKRFGRDGYKTVLEDSEKRYYSTGEIKVQNYLLIL